MAAKELKSCLLSKLSKKIFVFHHSRTVDPLISLPHTCIFQRESHNKWRPDEKKSKKRKSLLQNCRMLRAFDGGKGILGAVLNAWARFPMLSCLRASPTSVQVRGWKLFNFQHVTLVYCIPLCVTVPVWSQMIKEKCLLHISSERKKKRSTSKCRTKLCFCTGKYQSGLFRHDSRAVNLTALLNKALCYPQFRSQLMVFD